MFHQNRILNIFSVLLYKNSGNIRSMSLQFHGKYKTAFAHPLLMSNFVRLNSIKLSSCWKCQAVHDKPTTLFCNQCNVIQQPYMDRNYFDLLGMKKDFHLNVNSLAKTYKDMQRLLHPDKYSMKSQEEQDIAAEYSSLVNKAYSTLRNPWLRGTYLLKLGGIDFDETTSVDDPGFLFQVMEINEAIADTQNISTLKKLQNDNFEKLESAISDVDLAFKDENLEKAKIHLITLRYLTNISDKISEKLYSLGERK